MHTAPTGAAVISMLRSRRMRAAASAVKSLTAILIQSNPASAGKASGYETNSMTASPTENARERYAAGA